MNPNQLISEMLRQTDQHSLCSRSVLLVLSQEGVTGNSANTAGPGGWGGVIRCSHTCCLTSSQNNLCGQHPLTVLRQGTSDRSGGWPGGTQPAMTQPGLESLSILLYLLLFLSCPKSEGNKTVTQTMSILGSWQFRLLPTQACWFQLSEATHTLQTPNILLPSPDKSTLRLLANKR